MNQPVITKTSDGIVIRIPKAFLGDFEYQAIPKVKKKKKVDFSWMIGLLANDPSVKGKTSVQVQHETKNLWLETD